VKSEKRKIKIENVAVSISNHFSLFVFSLCNGGGVSMLVIPAIDLKKGAVVRLTQGEKDTAVVYSDDPAEIARLWESKGAELIHVVDLDGAMAGHHQNLESVKKIVDAVSIPVQFGGGVRSIKTIEEVLNIGVARVIIGSKAAMDPNLVQEAVAKFNNKVIVGIDAKGGKVAVYGWQQMTEYSALDLAQEMKRNGVTTIIYTDIARDGMLEGPNFDAIRNFTQAIKLDVIAAGGVTTIDDIKKLLEFEKMGLKGAIIGKALYTGKTELSEAIKMVKDAHIEPARETITATDRFRRPFKLKSEDEVVKFY